MFHLADVDTRHSGSIFYRQTTNKTILNKAEIELEHYFPDEGSINLEWAFIATWFNVTYFQDLEGDDEAHRKRNTFQAILLTDGSQSFVIFYYNEIAWTTGDVSSGTNGLGGTQAEAGYDNGDGKNYIMINGSCEPSILNISITSNVNSSGRWMFKANSYYVNPTPPPGCQANYTGEFCLTPNTIMMVGFEELGITGLQLSSTESAVCRFYDPSGNTTESNATIVTLTYITCDRPVWFYTTGRVKVEIETWSTQSNTKNRTLTGYVYIKHPTEIENTLEVSVNDDKSLKFSWNPASIINRIKNLNWKRLAGGFVFKQICTRVLDHIENIHITQIGNLFSIDDVLNGNATVPYAYFTEINYDSEKGILDDICPNANPNKIFCGVAWGLIVGYVDDPLLLTNPIGILANVGQAAAMTLLKMCGTGLAQKACQAIYDHEHNQYFDENLIVVSSTEGLVVQTTTATSINNESFWPNVLKGPNDVPPCPPTETLASLDPNFFIEQDCCILTPDVDICYISATPSPSGGGQRCCYKNHQIYLKAPGAGYSMIAHPSLHGGYPHLALDVSPWYYCCALIPIQSVQNLCDKLFNHRHPDSGNNYTSPTSGLGNGDPHFTTFDGLYYTFNGAGEFWLLKNNSEQPFTAQARTLLPSGLSSSWAALGAYALKSPNSSVVQVERNPFYNNKVVYYDSIPIPLESLQNGIHFNDVFICYFSEDDSILVSYSNGFSFKFNYWAFTSYIDIKYKGNYTRGLLGIYDGNPFDDLESPAGIIVPANSTTEVIHYKFGLKWYVSEEDSLFDYFGKNYSDYYFPEFKPSFGYSPGQLPPDATEICGNDPSCLWDLVTTGDKELANATKGNQEQFNNTISSTNVTIIMCSSLEPIENGFFSINNYLPNSTAYFTCTTGYELDGNSFITCLENGSWNGTEPICLYTTTTEEALTTEEHTEPTKTSFSPKPQTTATAMTTPSKSRKNDFPLKYLTFLLILTLMFN